jgi:hypothetical protein
MNLYDIFGDRRLGTAKLTLRDYARQVRANIEMRLTYWDWPLLTLLLVTIAGWVLLVLVARVVLGA